MAWAAGIASAIGGAASAVGGAVATMATESAVGQAVGAVGEMVAGGGAADAAGSVLGSAGGSTMDALSKNAGKAANLAQAADKHGSLIGEGAHQQEVVQSATPVNNDYHSAGEKLAKAFMSGGGGNASLNIQSGQSSGGFSGGGAVSTPQAPAFADPNTTAPRRAQGVMQSDHDQYQFKGFDQHLAAAFGQEE